MYCPSCGAVTKRQAETCAACGARVGAASPAPVAVVNEQSGEKWVCPGCGREAVVPAGKSRKYRCKECGRSMTPASALHPGEERMHSPSDDVKRLGEQVTETNKPGWDEMYCSSCGAIIKRRAEI